MNKSFCTLRIAFVLSRSNSLSVPICTPEWNAHCSYKDLISVGNTGFYFSDDDFLVANN